MPRGQGAGKDFEIYLEIVESGVRLNEHRFEHHEDIVDASHMDGWIECEPNTTFRIIIKDLLGTPRTGSEMVRGRLYIDGRMANVVLMQGTTSWTIDAVYMKRDGVLRAYPIKASAVNTVDSLATADLDLYQASKVSSIKLELQYGSVHGEVSAKQCIMEELGTMWEEHVKFGSMVNSDLTDLTPVADVAAERRAVNFTEAGKPFYEFNMRYCALVVLQQKEICPQPIIPEAQPKRVKARRPVPAAATRKRLRSPSISSDDASSSTSDLSAIASADLLGGASGMGFLAVMMNAFNTAIQSAAKQGQKAKTAKEEKKAKKQKERKDGSKRRAAIDLTGDTDDEESGEGSRPAAKAAIKESEVDFKVKQEMVDEMARRGD